MDVSLPAAAYEAYGVERYLTYPSISLPTTWIHTCESDKPSAASQSSRAWVRSMSSNVSVILKGLKELEDTNAVNIRVPPQTQRLISSDQFYANGAETVCLTSPSPSLSAHTPNEQGR